jgi:uncharacterized membrane protein
MQARDHANSPEVENAWRFFHLNWFVVGSTAAALALSVALSSFTIAIPGLLVAIGYVGVYGFFAHANARSPKRRDPQVMFVLGCMAQVVCTTAMMTPLTYVAAAINVPLQDANLLALDRALGLDWASYVHWVDERPMLAMWFGSGYTMIAWPISAIPVVLAAKRNYQRIEEFTFAFAVALIMTTIISALVPAIGVYQQIGLDPATLKNVEPGGYLQQLHDLVPTREGSLRQLDLLGLAGIVTFPSFHAASAVLFTWALWPARWIRPIALLANGAMLAATPVVGGHYFVDVFAGVAVAVLAIVAARRVGQFIARRQSVAALPAPIAPILVPAE